MITKPDVDVDYSKIYPFENMIFSLYQRWQGDQEEFEAICSWSKKHNLKAITIWNSLCTNQIMDIAKKYQVNICVHTENNVRRAINFLNNGVSAIYTDKIKIEDIS